GAFRGRGTACATGGSIGSVTLRRYAMKMGQRGGQAFPAPHIHGGGNGGALWESWRTNASRIPEVRPHALRTAPPPLLRPRRRGPSASVQRRRAARRGGAVRLRWHAAVRETGGAHAEPGLRLARPFPLRPGAAGGQAAGPAQDRFRPCRRLVRGTLLLRPLVPLCGPGTGRHVTGCTPRAAWLD